jgi:dTDP-4-dehydrorhamnose reductase
MERAVLDSGATAAVARVTLVTGRGHGARGTASEAVAWALRAGRRVRLYTDQWRTPVDADSVAEAVAAMLERRASGIFHLAGPDRLTRYGLGLRVAAALHLPADLIEPVTFTEHPGDAPRPGDVSLANERARVQLRWTPRSLEAGILLGRSAPDIIPARD